LQNLLPHVILAAIPHFRHSDRCRRNTLILCNHGKEENPRVQIEKDIQGALEEARRD
jgi:hypothetical protein